MKYATVKIDGMEIPLIGVPEEATLEECDYCHRKVHLSEITLTPHGKQVCQKCKEGKA